MLSRDFSDAFTRENFLKFCQDSQIIFALFSGLLTGHAAELEMVENSLTWLNAERIKWAFEPGVDSSASISPASAAPGVRHQSSGESLVISSLSSVFSKLRLKPAEKSLPIGESFCPVSPLS